MKQHDIPKFTGLTSHFPIFKTVAAKFEALSFSILPGANVAPADAAAVMHLLSFLTPEPTASTAFCVSLI